jgi:hypothetical protein
MRNYAAGGVIRAGLGIETACRVSPVAISKIDLPSAVAMGTFVLARMLGQPWADDSRRIAADRRVRAAQGSKFGS